MERLKVPEIKMRVKVIWVFAVGAFIFAGNQFINYLEKGHQEIHNLALNCAIGEYNKGIGENVTPPIVTEVKRNGDIYTKHHEGNAGNNISPYPARTIRYSGSCIITREAGIITGRTYIGLYGYGSDKNGIDVGEIEIQKHEEYKLPFMTLDIHQWTEPRSSISFTALMGEIENDGFVRRTVGVRR